ncbi:MAG TPA: GNAT family N-acetyltransferase, partial [Rhizobacter sp.]|nr:GNAT family N-acetyltransferase [Rhizobacter sp.]
GRGQPVGGPFSDYHGVIAAPSAQWELKPLLQAARLSVWAFDHLSGQADKFAPHVAAQATSPQLDLREGFEHYDRGRRQAGSDFSRKTQGLARKLGREVGELRFSFHEPDPGALQQVIDWKSAQYRRSAGTDAVFSRAWTGDLLRAVADIQTERFAGVCSVLHVGERRVAAHMGMRSRHHLHYWFPAYDTELSKFSTGSILLLRMAEAAPSQGIRVIDLGKGDSQYKRTLMTGAAPLGEGAVELPSLLTAARQMRRAAEAGQASGGVAAALLNVPVRAIRRLERMRRFR